MQQKMSKLKRVLLILMLIQVLLLVLFKLVLQWNIVLPAIFVAIEAILLLILTDRFETYSEEQAMGVRDMLQRSAKDAYLYGELGMVSYDEDHVVDWMSDLFEERGIHRVGTKVLVWLPEAEQLINGGTDTVTVHLDDRLYEITKKEDEPLLLFKDITNLNEYKLAYEEERSVVGMASLDNYEESTQYEDEAVVSAINVAVRTPLTEYCKEHGILVRRVNNYRYLLMLNEKIFSDLAADHFSILNTVRKAAQKQDVSITLSMAFALGSDNFQKLDEAVTKLMDLAQSRGGDQVAVQRIGEDVKYFGGSTEATEKRSRVRVRVMAQTLRELISRSSNVIICGHKEADFDCIGAAIGVARIVQALKKDVVIIGKTGGIESKLSHILEENKETIDNEITFVTDNEALNQLQEKTLVILVDHHNIKQSNGAKVLEEAKNIAIIDHHRRSTEMGFSPIFVYIEAGASSASELITELFPYISNQIELSELDATIMLTGMMIDTGRFRTRTGVRTYDAASALRRMGADPMKANEYLKDSYEEFAEQTQIMAMSEMYDHNAVIVPVKDMTISRATMSRAADSLLQIQNIDAVFVVASIGDGETAISARSNGKVNVQVIMEAMNGGGHMTAAAMQRSKTNVNDLVSELKQQIDAYFEEAENNESDTEE